MANIDVIHLIKEREQPLPEISLAQIPERPVLEAQATGMLATYDALRLCEPDGSEADLADSPTTSEEQELHQQLCELLSAVPELEQYLQLPPNQYTDLHLMDRSLQKTAAVNDGLVEDCAGAFLLASARVTEDCDALFGAGEDLINDSSLGIAQRARIDSSLYPANSTLDEVAAQVQGRRQRDARRAQQQEDAVRARENQLNARARLSELRAAELAAGLPPRSDSETLQ